MYKTLLIFKYLRRKLAPLFAAVAVTLCTAMVIIVISVMGGFLDMLRDSAKSITGDLVVEAAYGLHGFAHYEDLATRLEAMPQVAVATPAIRSMGLINFADGPTPVLVQGIDFAGQDRVIGLQPRTTWTREQLDERINWLNDLGAYELQGMERGAAAMREVLPTDPGKQNGVAGAWLGIEVFPGNYRAEDGSYDIDNSRVGGTFTLTVVPINDRGTIGSVEPARQTLLIHNEFKSGLYDVDSQTILVPLGVLQRMLRMDAKQAFIGADPDTGEGGTLQITSPARVNRIVIKVDEAATQGQTLQEVRSEVSQVVSDYFNELGEMRPIFVETWEEQHGQLIGAVKNEKGLITFLFIVISAVAVVMVATTFYMTVLEKTRDIGVLRAIGASRIGIATLFLGYGLAIGVVGAAAGTTVAALVVNYLNEIQVFLANDLGVTGLLTAALLGGATLGAVLGVVIGFVRRRLLRWVAILATLGALGLFLPALGMVLFRDGHADWLNQTFSFQMWDPQTYFFDTIPARLDTVEVGWIALGAVVSSVLGAVIPALVASAQNPVEALHHE